MFPFKKKKKKKANDTKLSGTLKKIKICATVHGGLHLSVCSGEKGKLHFLISSLYLSNKR